MPEFVFVDTRDGVATVTIRRPDLHNAFNEVMIDELTQAFGSLDVGGDARVAVLASEGRSFSAGADINWMKRMVGYSFDENVKDATTMADMLQAIRSCPLPTIARVHGATLGGGVGLVAACDMAVASANAFFCLSEVKLGIAPAVISPFVTEKIGPGQMRRYALTAEKFGAEEARRIGLVSEVVESPDVLDQRIAELVDAIRANSPRAIAACKPILSQVAGAHWEAVTEVTTHGIARLRVSDEGQDGLKAFLEKRKPGWIRDKSGAR